jgi:hypothetical protein
MVFVVLFLACAALVTGIWLAVRAGCRRLGLARRYQILIASAFCALPLLLWLLASLDRFDGPERICAREMMKASRMAGTTDLTVRQHYDFWTKTLSGGGVAMPWISRPYETPKVSLVAEFARDGRPHSAWIDCIFSKVPNTGDPPEIAFQDVRFSWENVREDLPSGGFHWAPWSPKSPDANHMPDARHH